MVDQNSRIGHFLILMFAGAAHQPDRAEETKYLSDGIRSHGAIPTPLRATFCISPGALSVNFAAALLLPATKGGADPFKGARDHRHLPFQCTARTVPPLPANAEQVAMPLIERLRAVVSVCGISTEEVALRQEISEAVIIATLDLEGVTRGEGLLRRGA